MHNLTRIRTFTGPGGRLALLLALLLAGFALAGHGDDSLEWNTGKNPTVSADLRDLPLDEVLERIAARTGWEIFVEPETALTVSARFSELSPGSALRRILGDLNFAILPQPNQPNRLYIYRTTMNRATRRVKTSQDRDNRITDELIVSPKDGADIDDLARGANATVTGYLEELGLYRLKFEDEAAARIAQERMEANGEAEVEHNYAIDRPPFPEAAGQAAALPLNLNPSPGSGSDALIVGLIDTAIQAGGFAHPDFLLQSISVTGEAVVPAQFPTHGTAMADVILRGLSMTAEGGDANVRILPVDVYGNNSATSTFDVARGIEAAINQGTTIINLSLGGPDEVAYMRTLIANATANGVLFVAAAGNQPVTTPVYPAAYPEVLATTAGTRSGEIAAYANRGQFVDIIAPGTGVVNFNGAAFLINGTSPASAFAAGSAAGLAGAADGNLTLTAESLRRILGKKTPSD